MAEDNLNTSEQLENILQEIESLSPSRDDDRRTDINYRILEDEKAINDSLEDELSAVEAETNTIESRQDTPETLPEVRTFESVHTVPVAAVDCAIIRLGETRNGLVIALRASIVIDNMDSTEVKLFKTGPVYLLNTHKAQILHKVGDHLYKPDLFVEIDNSDPENPKPISVKSGVADNAHQYGDRFRNWLERIVQKHATSIIGNGIVLLDGALTLRTRDTPRLYLERLAERAANNGNAIVAISKQSMLQIAGKPIQFWLDDIPDQPCYRLLTEIMRRENRERFLGNVFAARFSSLGPTFRMDVKPVVGQSNKEAIDRFYSSAFMRCGYPDILVRAHVHSYFTTPDVMQLQAQAGARYKFRPIAEPNLTGIFSPFGGRFK